MPNGSWSSVVRPMFFGGLVKLVADRGVDSIGLNPGAIHALWTLHGLGVLDGKTRKRKQRNRSLGTSSAGVRRNAMLTLPRTDWPDGSPQSHVTDTDAQVRLAAFLTLAEMPVRADAARPLLPHYRNQETATMPGSRMP